MERQGIIQSWSDRQILPGTESQGQIDHHLETAQIILLLISADFLASNYCYNVEMKRAMKRHDAGDACVIPVLLRSVDNLEGIPLGDLKTLPTGDKPVTQWSDPDEAFANIAKGIRAVVESWRSREAGIQAEKFIPDFCNIHESNQEQSQQRQRPDLEKRLIEKVSQGLCSFWGNQKDKWIPLKAKEMPDQVSHKINFREPTQTSFCIEELESVIFSLSNLRVLMLGEPGSGKSTALIKLSESLLERSKKEINSPIPVIFDLSNYRDKKQLMEDWLTIELSSQYQLGRNESRRLIKEKRIALMLDGLDEFACKSSRPANN